MPMIHTITHHEGITKITFLVSPTFDQLKSAVDEIAQNYPYEKRLWNMSEIEFDISTEE